MKNNPFHPFATEAEWVDYNNKHTELILDKILNYNGVDKFASEKMQRVASQSLPLKQSITDEEIEVFAKGRYPVTFMTKGQHECDLLNLQDAVIYGAKWMRDKLSSEIGVSDKVCPVKFLEWVKENRFEKYWGSDGPNNDKWYVAYTAPDRKYFTGEELLSIYKQSLIS